MIAAHGQTVRQLMPGLSCVTGGMHVHAGGGDERTVLGMLSAVERRVANLRVRADTDAEVNAEG